MICTLSNRSLTEQIRQLENLSPEMSSDELFERPVYFDRFKAHLRHFGLDFAGLTNVRAKGEIGDFRFNLIEVGYRQGDTRETYIEGLAAMNPLTIILEKADLQHLIINPMTRAVMSDSWPQIAGEFNKIIASELLDKLEAVAQKLIFTRRPEPTDEHEAAQQGILDNIAFENFCMENNLRVPAAKTPRELRQEEEIRQRKATARPVTEHESGFHVREF